MNPMQEISFTQVGGLRVGHAQDLQAATGCTVLLFDRCSPTGIDIRGGGPATRETPLLSPLAASSGLHGLVLSGGSAFGLDAAGGVMRYLEERGIGYEVGPIRVPLVSQACVFDLLIGNPAVRPDGAMAYAACEHATAGPVEEGNVGAGTGCTVGKYRGPLRCMKSGLGTFAVEVGGLRVGAIVAVNALGDVYDIDTGRQLAGLLTEDRASLCSSEEEMLRDVALLNQLPTGNTTIGAIVTNATLSKAEMNKVAAMAHNGYARTIRPVHTTADGDAIFAVSLGDCPGDVNIVGTLAAYVMGKAVNRAALAASSLGGLPAAADLL